MEFYKYSSTGNDFILIDNRDGKVDTNDKNYWQKLCARRTGIGADGVIFLEKDSQCDFKMKYLNADGGEVAMCGNGTRALTHFYIQMTGSNKEELKFSTMNGFYCAKASRDFVWVEMTEAYDQEIVDNSKKYSPHKGSYYMNTGVPHCVYFVDDVDVVNVYEAGRKIRYDGIFPEGVNINFISSDNEEYKVRTYERGVEDETLSCGTGITACAHFLWNKGIEGRDELKFKSRGGELTVKREDGKIFFGGPTEIIYKGIL